MYIFLTKCYFLQLFLAKIWQNTDFFCIFAVDFEQHMDSICHSIRLGARLYELDHPLVMAIINATPDSFFADSRAQDESSLRAAFTRAVNEGADIIDIGACSTRPTVQSYTDPLVDEEQEWQRLCQALTIARDMSISFPISVDTFRAEVARRAIEQFGVEMINDISGNSREMTEVVSGANVAYVLTYNRTHDTHQTGNLLADTIAFLSRGVDELHRSGVSDVVIDPGFGFGQSVSESLSLLANLSALRHIGCPILAGISRKRMAYEPAGQTPDTCLEQTLHLERQAILLGANILRVHDVAATKQMISQIENQS